MPSVGCGTPNATTQPRRTPATAAATSSISCGTRLRPPLMIRSLRRPGDVDLAVRREGEVAAVEPAAVERDGARWPRAGGSSRTSSTGRGRRAGRRGPRAGRGRLRPRCAPRARAAAYPPRRSAAPASPRRRRRRRRPRARTARAPTRVDARPAARRREAERHRALGQAVDRHHRLAPEAVAREALREALQRVGADGLRAVERAAPGREVQALERARPGCGAAHSSYAKLGAGGERGRGARGSPTASARAAPGTTAATGCRSGSRWCMQNSQEPMRPMSW